MSRLLRHLGLCAATAALLGCAQVPPPQELVIEPEFVSRSFSTIGKDVHLLERPLKLSFKGLPTIVVPAGFVTDLASIPPTLQAIESKTGPSMAPAIVHDYLYWYQPCSKDEADAVFYVAMLSVEVGRTKTPGMFQIVSDFTAYEQNRQRRLAGEKRTFTDKYRKQIENDKFNPNEPLESVLDRARARAGLVDQENPVLDVKETCKAILNLCTYCQDYIAKKAKLLEGAGPR